MKRAFAFLTLALLPWPAAAQKRPMTYEDILALQRPSDPQISPDGTRVAFVVSEWNKEEDGFNEDLYLVTAPSGDLVRLTYHPKRDRSPRWSPDGRSLTFLSDRGDKTQIYVMSLPGGEPRRLTEHKESIGSLAWGKDGNALFFLAPEPKKEDEEDKGKKTKKIVVVDADLPYAHIWRVDVETGEVAQLTRGELHVAEVEPSPDGRVLAFIGQRTPKVADALTAELYTIPVSGGEIRRLTENGYGESDPEWSPDGSQIAYLSAADGNPAAGPARIHIVPAAGGQARVLARNFDGYIEHQTWLPDGKAIVFHAGHGVNEAIYRIASTSGEKDTPQVLTDGDGLFGPFSIDAQGSAMATVHQDPEHPPDVWWRKSPGEDLKPLTQLNPGVKDWALGRVETLRWKSTDGVEVEGLVVYPVDYQPGKRYPTILQVHGGPEGAYTREFMAGYNNFPHVYAAAGYVTLMPNFRGSSNYGATFAQANKGDAGGGDYRDCMSGLDYLIEKGIADPERLAIKGWSYGGYMSGWAVGHTDRFKAAAYGAGLSNSVSYYGTADIQFSRENLHNQTPYINRDRWIEQSPLTYVQQVKTPCLIFHGEKDERVPLGQSQEFYMGLRKHGVTAELVIYPDQPHGLQVPSYQLDKMKRELEWIEKYLR